MRRDRPEVVLRALTCSDAGGLETGGAAMPGFQLTRRGLLQGCAALLLAGPVAACRKDGAMTQELWQQWQADWQRMQEIVLRRGWDVTTLKIAPPATEASLRAIETRNGLIFPPQLREILTRYSSAVTFGWYIPPHLQPQERQNLPNMSANRDALWDVQQIEELSIPNFLGWKRDLAHVDQSEAPNTPQMWENQFPLYNLVNGDMVTIDMLQPDGPQPVRYFSHELEMLHGLALAPDLITFITHMSKLGFAGTEWASWMAFGQYDEAARTYYLTADSPGGKAWLEWLEKDPAEVGADMPPPAIVEETPAERALLDSAREQNIAGVTRALSNGARPDVVPNSDWLRDTLNWGDEFATALNYAVMAGNTALADVLLAAGATLNTRRLVMGDAVSRSSLPVVEWLIAKGARVNGWKDDRYWPLHQLIVNRSRMTAASPQELEASLREEYAPHARNPDLPPEPRKIDAFEDNLIKEQVKLWLDRPTYLNMVEALLKAGADPDARWDNDITMLMQADADAAELLLKAGADVDARNIHGGTALHWARSPEKIRLLAAHGADVNALQTPRDAAETGSTPLQSALILSRLGSIERVQSLLVVGADPKKRDSRGQSSLCYCTTIDTFKLMAGYGLDPKERLPDGGTLLHNLFRMTSVRASWKEEVAFLDYLLSLGLPINAADNAGQTMLHVAAESATSPKDIALLLDRGANKTIRDKEGNRPVDLVAPSLEDIRKLLS